MNKKILIAGFACLSVIAVAQSSGTKDQSAGAAQARDQHPKEVASGQASGKTVAPTKLTSAQPAITDNKKTSQPAGSAAMLNNDSAASEQVTAPRDMATGQASGKRQYAPVIIRKVSDDEGMAAREQQSPKATGKATAHDDWQAPAAKTSNGAPASSSGQTRVAAGDVNGDGKADAAINNSHSNIKNSKDAATGQATGKRQHSDITITK